VQNVGAYGQEVSSTIASVRVLDRDTIDFLDLPASACAFSYRRSLFNSSARDRFVVTGVTYELQPNATPVLQYPDLKRYFGDRPNPPSLAETAAAVREIRRGKGMLLVDGDPDCRSAGSFFKNPVVAQSRFDAIAGNASSFAPGYPAQPGFVKIPAAWLVENAGFRKGFALGAAGISSRHTLALINRGGATAAEIVALRDLIVSTVEKKFAIQLEPEPVFLRPG
jgi:UDP-N-acetylmuramate dehydrogenase